MINITLKQLRYFEALASHGHFGRAATASAVSQPALSVQIKELEETLGAPLRRSAQIFCREWGRLRNLCGNDCPRGLTQNQFLHNLIKIFETQDPQVTRVVRK